MTFIPDANGALFNAATTVCRAKNQQPIFHLPILNLRVTFFFLLLSRENIKFLEFCSFFNYPYFHNFFKSLFLLFKIEDSNELKNRLVKYRE